MKFALTSLALGLLVLSGCATPPPVAPDAALEKLDAAIAAQPDSAELRARRGHRHAELAHVGPAMADLDAAVALDPNNPTARKFRALLLHGAGRQAEARADIDEAVRLRSDDIRAVSARCVIRVAQERTEAGLEDCRRAQQLDGLKAVALSATAQAQLLLGRPREALAGFDAVLAVQPNFMRALYGRGVARQALGDAAGRDDVAEALRRLPGAAAEFLPASAS